MEGDDPDAFFAGGDSFRQVEVGGGAVARLGGEGEGFADVFLGLDPLAHLHVEVGQCFAGGQLSGGLFKSATMAARRFSQSARVFTGAGLPSGPGYQSTDWWLAAGAGSSARNAGAAGREIARTRNSRVMPS